MGRLLGGEDGLATGVASQLSRDEDPYQLAVAAQVDGDFHAFISLVFLAVALRSSTKLLMPLVRMSM
jgi:hypothetical protein